jgi:hypothetical protein
MESYLAIKRTEVLTHAVILMSLKNICSGQDLVAHICHPSYLGDRGRGLRQGQPRQS